MALEPDDIKNIVLNTDKPCIIKNLDLNWKCLKSMNLSEWCSLLNESFAEGIPFEVARIKHNKHPQWERHRELCRMTMEEYMNKYDLVENSKHWATFSYKGLNILPKECQEGVNFDRFGFPGLEFVNFWFGSKAAHTSAHFDSYGCNIVVQIYGRKSWLLFPPNEHLSPTRVPYEESSVYCKENFYCPSEIEQFESVADPHHVILEAGDVLIIPRHWWHYAENLETSLSINTWIPLDVDVNSQIDECIVQTQISQITNTLSEDMRSVVVNPNEIDTLENFNLPTHLDLLQNLLYHSIDAKHKKLKLENFPYKYLSPDEFKELLQKCKQNVQLVKSISREDFLKLLKINSGRYDSTMVDGVEGSAEYKSIYNYVNSICNPEVLQMVKNNLIKELPL